MQRLNSSESVVVRALAVTPAVRVCVWLWSRQCSCVPGVLAVLGFLRKVSRGAGVPGRPAAGQRLEPLLPKEPGHQRPEEVRPLSKAVLAT